MNTVHTCTTGKLRRATITKPRMHEYTVTFGQYMKASLRIPDGSVPVTAELEMANLLRLPPRSVSDRGRKCTGEPPALQLRSCMHPVGGVGWEDRLGVTPTSLTTCPMGAARVPTFNPIPTSTVRLIAQARTARTALRVGCRNGLRAEATCMYGVRQQLAGQVLFRTSA